MIGWAWGDDGEIRCATLGLEVRVSDALAIAN